MTAKKINIIDTMHRLASETDAAAHLKTVEQFAGFFDTKTEILGVIKRGKPSLIDSFLEISSTETTNHLKLEKNRVLLDLNRKLKKYYKTNNYTKIAELAFDFLTQALSLCSNIGAQNSKKLPIKDTLSYCIEEDQEIAILYALIGSMVVPKNFNWKREDRVIDQSLVLAGWAFSKILYFIRDKLSNLKISDLKPEPLEKVLPPIKLHLFDNKKTEKMDGMVCSNCDKSNFLARKSLINYMEEDSLIVCEKCAVKKFQEEENISSFKAAFALWRRRDDLFYLFIEMCLEELLNRNIVKIEVDPEDILFTVLVWANSLYKNNFTVEDKKKLARVADQSLIERALYKIIKSAKFSTSETIYRTSPKIGRNNPCSCGSGKKYKKCCGKM